MHAKNKPLRGYTIIELLLSVALITSIALYSFPMLVKSQAKNDLDVASKMLTAYIGEAQVTAMSQNGNSDAGVYVSGGNLTFYTGDTYATRVSANDLVVPLTDGVSSVANYDLSFTKRTGQLPASITIILQNSLGDQKNIIVSTYGKVSF